MIYPKQIPKFVKDVQYQELHPKVGKYLYRYKTLDDIELVFHNSLIPQNQTITFSDEQGRIWLTITHKSIIISKNYAWNGCSPKRWWLVWWGTPDFEETLIASLFHDALVQFVYTEHFPLSRYICDNIFKNILYMKKFKFVDIYYIGVRVGSEVLPINKYVGKSNLTTLSQD
jgi:hypothetical protein